MGTSYWYSATNIASISAATTLLGTAGTMAIYSGTQPIYDQTLTGTLLVTLKLANPTPFATPTSSGGVTTSTANTITSGTAVATNTAGYFALLATNGTTVVALGNVSTTGANLNLNSTSISSGAVVSVSSFSITQSETGT